MKALLVVLFFLTYSFRCYSTVRDIEKMGDLFQIALPTAALSASYFLEDNKTPENLSYKQFVKSFASGFAATHIMKLTLKKKRPNENNSSSFPSGHTFAAFSGAAFIQSRFGSTYGVPAFLLAGFVGYSRVKSLNHFADDVLAGASIGYLFNEFYTKENNLEIGVAATNELKAIVVKAPIEETHKTHNKNRLNMEFLIGPTYMQSILLNDAKNAKFELHNLQSDVNHNYTSMVTLNYGLASKDKISFTMMPYEHIAKGQLAQDIQFDGISFQKDEQLSFDWVHYGLDLEYLKEIFQLGNFKAQTGLGLLLNFGEITVASLERQFSYKSQKIEAIGNILLNGIFKLNSKNQIASKINWYNDTATKYLKFDLTYSHELNTDWSGVIKLLHQTRHLTMAQVDTGSEEVNINSHSSFNSIFMGIRHSL